MSTNFQLASTTHALLPEKCTEELFLKWSKLSEIPESIDENSVAALQNREEERWRRLKLVKSDWIVESLKSKKILCTRPFLHSLQLPPSPSIETPELHAQQSHSVITTPRMITAQLSTYGPRYRNADVVKGHPHKAHDRSTRDLLEQSTYHKHHDQNLSHTTSRENIEQTETNQVDSTSYSTRNNCEKAIYDIIIPTNRNTHITDILKQMVVFYDLLGDNFREMVYNRCCGVLETHHKKIEDIAEISKLPGVGKSLRDKISEILQTGRLEKLEIFKKDVRLSAVVDLGRIWGLGPKGVQNLFNLGYRCVDDVKDHGMDVLTPQQKIGSFNLINYFYSLLLCFVYAALAALKCFLMPKRI